MDQVRSSGRVAPAAFDEVAAFEAGSGADDGDEVGCVHGPPTLPGGLHESEAHGQGGGAGPTPWVTLVRSRTVEKVHPMRFAVRRWIQCPAEMPWNASSWSRSSVIFLAGSTSCGCGQTPAPVRSLRRRQAVTPLQQACSARTSHQLTLVHST